MDMNTYRHPVKDLLFKLKGCEEQVRHARQELLAWHDIIMKQAGVPGIGDVCIADTKYQRGPLRIVVKARTLEAWDKRNFSVYFHGPQLKKNGMLGQTRFVCNHYRFTA